MQANDAVASWEVAVLYRVYSKQIVESVHCKTNCASVQCCSARQWPKQMFGLDMDLKIVWLGLLVYIVD